MNNLKIFYISYFNANDIENYEFFKKCRRRVFKIYYLIFFFIYISYKYIYNYIFLIIQLFANYIDTYRKIDII